MRRLLAAWLLVVLPAPLPANEFDWMIREFSRESGAERVNVPFLGLASFVVRIGHPAGTSEMKLAIFERSGLEGERFSRLTDATVGGSWKPMIRVRSRNADVTNIYERTEGKHLNVLLTTLDGENATFVQVRLDPKALMKFIEEHGGETAHVRMGY